MVPDLVQIRALAKGKEDENWRFRQFLKEQCHLDSSAVDEKAFEATKRVWAEIDCTTCANCCRDVKPTFSEAEVGRLAERMGIAQQQFIDAYLEGNDAGEEKPWQTKTKPCPFLKDNHCSVYEDRPADCRNYPYLYEPNFIIRTMAMIQRTSTCPIVYEVMQELKRTLDFSRR